MFSWFAQFFTVEIKKEIKAQSLKNCLCLKAHAPTMATILGTLCIIFVNKQQWSYLLKLDFFYMKGFT